MQAGLQARSHIKSQARPLPAEEFNSSESKRINNGLYGVVTRNGLPALEVSHGQQREARPCGELLTWPIQEGARGAALGGADCLHVESCCKKIAIALARSGASASSQARASSGIDRRRRLPNGVVCQGVPGRGGANSMPTGPAPAGLFMWVHQSCRTPR
jgi:hypothetical protein